MSYICIAFLITIVWIVIVLWFEGNLSVRADKDEDLNYITLHYIALHVHLTYIVWIILVLWFEDKMCESADKDEDAVEGEGD